MMHRTELDMKYELKEFGDNPFDLLMYYALKLVKASLEFSMAEEPGSQVRKADEAIDVYTKDIRTVMNMISPLSKQTLQAVKNSSLYGDNSRPEGDDLIDQISVAINMLDVGATRTIPAHSLEFDRIIYGCESAKYKRFRELHKLSTMEMFDADPSTYDHYIDVIKHPEECVGVIMTQEEFDAKKTIVDQYQLSPEDIYYIRAIRCRC